VVFIKGCPLRCQFCQNPETQKIGQELSFDKTRCIGCLVCVSRCERHAIEVVAGRPFLHRDRCVPCEACSVTCPSGAFATIGRSYSIEALAEILLRDESYYRHSQGGVTFSGGECTLYPEFMGGLARYLKDAAIHLALQTCGYFVFDDFAHWFLPHLDLIFFDIKLADRKRHQLITGTDNQLIWDNLEKLLSLVPDRVHPRVPLIQGMTNDEPNKTEIIRRLTDLGAREPIFLSENHLGAAMRPRLVQAT
jgi:pyruvate formate lyase activating enzyme